MLNIVVSCCIMNHVVSLLGVCFINLTSSLVLLKVIQPAGQQAYISHGYAKPGEVPQTSESQHQTIKWNRFWTFLNVFEIWSNHPGFASLNSFCGLWPSRPLICAFTAMRVANWLRVVWTCLNMFEHVRQLAWTINVRRDSHMTVVTWGADAADGGAASWDQPDAGDRPWCWGRRWPQSASHLRQGACGAQDCAEHVEHICHRNILIQKQPYMKMNIWEHLNLL